MIGQYARHIWRNCGVERTTVEADARGAIIYPKTTVFRASGWNCGDDAGGKAESVRVSSMLASYSRDVKRSSVIYCNGGCPGIVSYLGVHGMNKGATASAPKLDEVVCAHNFSTRKGAKPILQATVSFQSSILGA